MKRVALAVLLLAAAASCGPRGAARASEPAAHGVSAYLAALRSDDPRRAYSLLSDEVRKEMPYDSFAALWKQHATERQYGISFLTRRAPWRRTSRGAPISASGPR